MFFFSEYSLYKDLRILELFSCRIHGPCMNVCIFLEMQIITILERFKGNRRRYNDVRKGTQTKNGTNNTRKTIRTESKPKS